MNVFKGEISSLPPDKSISHRSALIGALAEGTTESAAAPATEPATGDAPDASPGE